MQHCSLHWPGYIGLSLVLFQVPGSYLFVLIRPSVGVVVLPGLRSLVPVLYLPVLVGGALKGQFSSSESQC